ncbi:unnamed protein product [Cylindrotheca closterium]|uniref:Uncharacterized protein n=1 Tax=Cylindrotheca closterium TaxID=2856 RepID=A0AAD2PXS0_9STRA|nr:unnamed protein product [Cylindrotheca closterium]
MNREMTRGRAQDKAAVKPIRQPSKTRDFKVSPSFVCAFPGSDQGKIRDTFSSVGSTANKQGRGKANAKNEITQIKPSKPVARAVSFVAQSDKVDVLSLDDYSDQEREAYWYTKTELRSIRIQRYAKPNSSLSNRSRSLSVNTKCQRWNA